MNKTIFKYQLPIDDGRHVIAFNGKILHFGIKPNENFVSIWAEVDELDFTLHHTKTFRVYGTGHNIPHSAKWEATIIADFFVWHVYSL